MTIAFTFMFFKMIWGFVVALMLARVFSGILHPLYIRFNRFLNGRSTPASLLTLLFALLLIVLPLLFLLGLVAEQAIDVTVKVQPLVEQRLNQPSDDVNILPTWLPYSDKLEPYREQISAKQGEFTENIAVFLASSLGRFTQGTMVFFLNLFLMLYAMFFFLISGPQLLQAIMAYLPLSQPTGTSQNT